MAEKLIDKLKIVDEKPNIAERLAYGSLGFAVMKNIKSKVHDNTEDEIHEENKTNKMNDAQDIANNIDISSFESQQTMDQLSQ